MHYNPKRSVWILTRFDDVRTAARADTALSSADGVTRTKFSLPILITTDGERHAQMRRQILPAFTKAALDSWRPMIDRLAVELVGDVLDNPGCDAVQRLAVPMPMRLIAHMLGVPDTDVDEFRRWSEAAVQVTDLALTRRGVSKLAASVSGSRSIHRYFYRQFAVGGLKGSDTILGRLLAKNEDGTITEDELFYFANLLLLAGNETTTNLLGGMFDTLARNPDSYNRLRADHSLIPMHRQGRLPCRRCHDSGRRTRAVVVRRRQPRSTGVRRPRRVPGRPESQPAHRIRLRHAPVPRRPADPNGGTGRAARARHTRERDRTCRRDTVVDQQLATRARTHARKTHSCVADASTSRAIP